MTLDDLRRLWPAARFEDFSELAITGVTADSRQVRPGDLFVAIPGTKADGLAYVPEAVSRGAAAVCSERPVTPPSRLPRIVVPDARRAIGEAADLLYGRPSMALTVVGITGTNGKTTTSHLVKAILEAAGRRSGLLGTVTYVIGDREIPASTTTPDPVSLHRMFAEMRDAGLDAVVMEVSSHALHQSRTASVRFAAGVFTNLTRDHLDYHKTMEAYRDAKGILFRQLPPAGVAALNLDDPAGAVYAAETPARVVGFSGGARADVRAEGVSTSLDGNRFTLVTPAGSIPIVSPLIGGHNVANVLAAAAVAYGLDLPLEAIRRGVESVRRVRGRLDPVEAGQPFRVFVDYAHTDDALENVLRALRPLSPRRLITLFGCGGDRDRGKRPLMARVAERYSDRVVLTSDNPRSESPAAILGEIARGFARPAEHESIEDRAEAIARAVGIAGPGDVVLLAGKGHETGQIFRDVVKPFDDASVAREALAARGYHVPSHP
ncbi:MAG: UDP-N-acetylmuramoyl-L-alanyl-D-glutamate--2,6-diaminopimelate ligase [Planctomycetes bacterium]|nr:UDP-N-acetylmuramoyl-L-alanyl-D-glutamate--2,6-diaminopimelate ligase [Planctomycetota bacterium]